MNRDELARDILLVLLRMANPDSINHDHLIDCSVMMADALMKRLCQPQPQ